MFFRALNQERGWEEAIATAAKPVAEAIQEPRGLRFNRREMFVNANHAAIRHTQNWTDTCLACGGFGFRSASVTRLPSQSTWQVEVRPPSWYFESPAFEIITMKSFPAAAVIYLWAQAVKALHQVEVHVMTVVSILIAYWVLMLVGNLCTIMAN